MAGLKTLVQQRADAVKAIREHTDKLETARDSDRAADLGRGVVQAVGDAIEAITIIDHQKAWAEVDALPKQQDGQGGC